MAYLRDNVFTLTFAIFDWSCSTKRLLRDIGLSSIHKHTNEKKIGKRATELLINESSGLCFFPREAGEATLGTYLSLLYFRTNSQRR